MKQLVEFTLEDGSTILVEVEEPPTPGPEPVSRPGEIAAKAKKTFAQALDDLQPMMKQMRKKIDAFSESGDEIEVKFGVKLSGQVGAVVTAGAEASYEVTVKWSKK
ncbi:hypothetical protein IQ249_22365 [Lusitaniella coriacea LEGE 07157]|uniref:Trypsin-co-occurring domain-containing protein n=2 Tax=Cyanophyceae TaxID=3028117 RepID=A0A8J7IXB7_9CYAN|nr:CU044_2847 family protein [Lusitaniella coriacea]MBE9097844.1 hypothetical protein [Tychonema sp. LEGE 07203]MBE9118637.1 hypothetical protein [Lusitaniella coriacea LEGE 07157]